jgi:cell division protein FtsL
MLRINIILFLATLALALGVVAAQHQSRKLYFELEQQQQLTKRYRTEFDQLQIEQSTWAMHSRLEEVARGVLTMHSPASQQSKVVEIYRK